MLASPHVHGAFWVDAGIARLLSPTHCLLLFVLRKAMHAYSGIATVLLEPKMFAHAPLQNIWQAL